MVIKVSFQFPPPLVRCIFSVFFLCITTVIVTLNLDNILMNNIMVLVILQRRLSVSVPLLPPSRRPQKRLANC